MIILDTDVISEVMRGSAADRTELSWIRTLPEQPVTTVINRAEIMAGVALLPDGRRRDRLWTAVESAFDSLGAGIRIRSASSADRSRTTSSYSCRFEVIT